MRLHDPSDEELTALILEKMDRRGFWGGRHTDFHNVAKGFPPQYQERIKELLEGLMRKGWVVPKRTSYGLHVWLNPKMSKEIREYIDRYLPVGS